MRKILACVLVLSLVLSISGLSVMAETDYSGLVEECLTTEVKNAISKNLAMISTWKDTPITWESSNPDVLNPNGTVKRGDNDQTVTLTAMADGIPVKTLTYTVLSKNKKVYYSENFNRPECIGKEMGIKNATGLHNLDFIETSESLSGKAGFYNNYGAAFNGTTSLTIEKNPFAQNDYELCGKSLEKNMYFMFELPATELPGGKVTISADFTSTELKQFPLPAAYRKHQYISFYSDNGNLINQIHWLAAGTGKIRNGAIDAVTGMTSMSNGDAMSSSLKIVINFTNHEFEITETSNGVLNANKLSIPSETLSLKRISFAGRTVAQGFANPDFWIDNLVIISE